MRVLLVILAVIASAAQGGAIVAAYRYTQKPAAVPMPTLQKRPGIPGGA